MEIKGFNWGDRVRYFKPLKSVNYLVVHHSDSGDVPAAEVDRWHQGKGWLGIGYHFLIRENGSIEGGRPENVIGAHTLNYNSQSIGICLAGDFMKDKPTVAQMDALVGLLGLLRGKYPQAKIVRHGELQATSCPGNLFPWSELMGRVDKPGPFCDVAGDRWSAGHIERVKKLGLMVGDGDGAFGPELALTREQLAAVICKLLDRGMLLLP